MASMAAFLGVLLLGSMNTASAQSPGGQPESSSLPLSYSAKTLHGFGEAGCPTDQQQTVVRNKIFEEVYSKLQDTVVPALFPENDRPCGCGGPGWTRLAYLNMTNLTEQCPLNWDLHTSPVRACGGSNNLICDSATFDNTNGIRYSQVCGRIIGYQKDTPEAFGSANSGQDIDDPYVDGVSLTHGSPREHVWTFAAARDETIQTDYVCPCTNLRNSRY